MNLHGDKNANTLEHYILASYTCNLSYSNMLFLYKNINIVCCEIYDNVSTLVLLLYNNETL